MYRSAAIFLIIFLYLPAFSVDSRVERWNQRIDKLKKIQDEAASGKADKALIDRLVRDEIKSSAEFLSILNRYKAEDGSLISDKKKYSITEIEKKVKDISLPAISLYYISFLYKTADDIHLKEKIAGDIIQYATKKSGFDIKISPAESIIMAEHYIIEKGMDEYDSAVKNTTADLLSKTEYEMSRSDYNSNDTDITRMIQNFTEQTLSDKKFTGYTIFNEKYLTPVPEWKFTEQRYSGVEERNKSVAGFVNSANGSTAATYQTTDIYSAEKVIFEKAKDKISGMLQNTTPSSGSDGNNPNYNIPDLKKLGLTLDEIDRYRKTLIQNINGSEDKDLISRLKNNNTGIALRSINSIDNQFKSEEMRIERIKKIKNNIVIYNEEIFKAAKSHFYIVREEIFRYATLSADFVSALYSSGKIDPQKYIEFHQYRSDRYIAYISFSEKLTADTLTLHGSGSEKLRNVYKGTIQKVLVSAKNLLKPETIPAEIRKTLKSDHIKNYADINADFRIKGSLLINGTRKNYDESIAGFSRSSALKKEYLSNSESQIGQDETDRLLKYSETCSGLIAGMNYTETAMNRYKNEYFRISEELRKGNKSSAFNAKNAPASFIESVPDFDSVKIETETATRELLSKEGMDALSSSITLVQYYKRKGVPVKFTQTNEEIISMKLKFSRSPEVIVSSWRMTGKNFRQTDANITAELKKLINKNAWDNNRSNSASETLIIDEPGIDVSFSPPEGWKKIPASGDTRINKITFGSPDMKGLIEVTSICEEKANLQALAGLWPERSGFSMIEKNWGKKGDSDYIKSTAKNSYDGVMESYMVSKKGYVIIVSGKTTGDMYRYLNRTLAEMFRNLEIKETSI